MPSPWKQPGPLCSSLEGESDNARGARCTGPVCPGDKEALSHRTAIKHLPWTGCFPVHLRPAAGPQGQASQSTTHVQPTPPLGPSASASPAGPGAGFAPVTKPTGPQAQDWERLGCPKPTSRGSDSRSKFTPPSPRPGISPRAQW